MDQSLAVWTRSKRRQMERESTGAPEGPTAHSSGEVLPAPQADPQPESEGGGNQSQGPEVEDEAGEDFEDLLPVRDGTEHRVMTGSETGGGDDAVTRGRFIGSKRTLAWARPERQPGTASWRAQAVESISFTEMYYCIDLGNLRGPSQGTCEVWNSWSCPNLAGGWSCALAMMYPWPAT